MCHIIKGVFEQYDDDDDDDVSSVVCLLLLAMKSYISNFKLFLHLFSVQPALVH